MQTPTRKRSEPTPEKWIFVLHNIIDRVRRGDTYTLSVHDLKWLEPLAEDVEQLNKNGQRQQKVIVNNGKTLMVYVGITPEKALINAYEQIRENYNTWDYPSSPQQPIQREGPDGRWWVMGKLVAWVEKDQEKET